MGMHQHSRRLLPVIRRQEEDFGMGLVRRDAVGVLQFSTRSRADTSIESGEVATLDGEQVLKEMR